MNRKQLVSALKDLDIPIKGPETEEELQALLNKALKEISQPETLEALESRMVSKSFACVGIFVDFAEVSCELCLDQVACVKKFIENFKGDFRALDKIESELQAKEEARETDLKALEEATKVEKKKVKEAKKKEKQLPLISGYNPAQGIGVYEVPIPVNASDEEYPFYEAILFAVVPQTVGELRAIIEEFCGMPETEKDKIEVVKSVIDILVKNKVIALL